MLELAPPQGWPPLPELALPQGWSPLPELARCRTGRPGSATAGAGRPAGWAPAATLQAGIA
jgi:hypothetical protein